MSDRTIHVFSFADGHLLMAREEEYSAIVAELVGLGLGLVAGDESEWILPRNLCPRSSAQYTMRQVQVWGRKGLAEKREVAAGGAWTDIWADNDDTYSDVTTHIMKGDHRRGHLDDPGVREMGLVEKS